MPHPKIPDTNTEWTDAQVAEGRRLVAAHDHLAIEMSAAVLRSGTEQAERFRIPGNLADRVARLREMAEDDERTREHVEMIRQAYPELADRCDDIVARIELAQ